MSEYTPIDLGNHKNFKADILRSKQLLVMPSQGEPGTKVVTGIEGEMLYEHRQEAEGMAEYPGIFVTRTALPQAEDTYRQSLFGHKRPKLMVPSSFQKGMSLDQIVLTTPGFIQKIAAEHCQR